MTRDFAPTHADCARAAPDNSQRPDQRAATRSARPFACRSVAVGSRSAAPRCSPPPLPPRRRAAPRPYSARSSRVVDDGAPDVVTYGMRDDVMRFADEVAERRDLDAGWVRRRLPRRASSPSVARYIMPPPAGTAKNWAAYRARFVEPIRDPRRRAFWRANERWLAQAEEIYGVPPEIVVGIVGVESIYGRQMGDFRVIDALATLAFDFPRRPQGPQRVLQGRARELVRALPERRHRPARLARQLRGRDRHGAVHAVELQQATRSTSMATAMSTCTPAPPMRSAASPTTSPSSAGSAACRPASTSRPPTETSERAVLLAPDIVPTFTAAEMIERGARLPRRRAHCRQPARPRRAAERRRGADLRRRNDQLLRAHALQLVELLRDGRAGARRERARDASAERARKSSIQPRRRVVVAASLATSRPARRSQLESNQPGPT